MEFLPPDAIQIVENKEVTCRMISLAFQENTVQENKVRMLIPRDEQGQIVVAAHPYDLARLCYS
jgi:hypothetical protein